jgi:general secretion pathway protein C
MGGRQLRWLLGAGLASVFGAQSRGVAPVHAGAASVPAAVHASLVPETFLERVAPARHGQADALVEPTPEPPPRMHRPAPPCIGGLGLVGAVRNERRPELSRVIVRARGAAAVLALGARIDQFVVHEVKSASVTLRDDTGALCTLPGFSSGAEPVPHDAPEASSEEPPEPPPRGKPVFSAQELAEGLHPIGHGEYAVKRAFLLKALTNPGGSAGGAWFRPSQLDGQSAGMEVLGIRDGSALEAMGMHSGDVIRDLNGISLDTTAGALSALRAAREAEHLTLVVLREGRPQELHFRVGD